MILFRRSHESDNPLKNFLFKVFGFPHIGTRIRADAVFSLILNFKPGIKVLDIGCGRAFFGMELQKRGAEVYYIDLLKGIDHKSIKSVRNVFYKDNLAFNFQVGFANKLPFKDDIFDIILIPDVIEHIKEEYEVISEMKRVLKSNGYFIASTPAYGFHSGKFKWFFRFIHRNTFLKYVPIWNENYLYPQLHMKAKVHLREYSLNRWMDLASKFDMNFSDYRWEYKLFGALFVELSHTFNAFEKYGGFVFFLFYPLVKLDNLLPIKGT